MISKTLVLFSGVLLLAVCNDSHGQIIGTEKNYRAFSSISVAAESEEIKDSKEKREAVENMVAVYPRKPVTLYLKNGEILRAYLLQNVSEDSDSIIIEVEGNYRTISFDRVDRFVQEAIPVDSFGKLRSNDIKARVDNFMAQVNNSPDSTAYIIYYGPSPAQVRAAKAIVEKTFRRHDKSRIRQVTADGCWQELLTEFWIVPAGGSAPPIKPGCQGRIPSKRSPSKPRKKPK